MKGQKVLTTKWVFVEKQKVKDDGNTIPFPRNRNVIRRFEKVQGLDYGATFAHAVKYMLVQVMWGKVAKKDLKFEQMDAIIAFWYRKIYQDVYIEILEGIEITTEKVLEPGLSVVEDNWKLDLVCKFKKLLYGKKQATRCWKSKLTSF